MANVLRGANYDFTIVTTPGQNLTAPYSATILDAINDRGRIVGTYVAGSVILRSEGVVGTAGSVSTFTIPNAWDTSISGINNLGWFVGTYQPAYPFATDGFLVRDGKTTTIHAPGSPAPGSHAYGGTSLTGINDFGEIVGNVSSSTANYGFLDVNGSFTTITAPGAVQTTLSGINDWGQIVGNYYDGNAWHAFIDTAGHFASINAPGASTTSVTGINNLGQIVGNYTNASGTTYAFVERGGHFTTVAVPGPQYSFTRLYGINDRGQLVGAFDSPNSVDRNGVGFVATPAHGLWPA